MKKLTKSNASVFVVEDEPMYCAMLERAIANEGYTNTTCFSSGEEVVKELYRMPDIVLLDHSLSGELSGLDVLRKIKSLNPDIHVIFISAQEKMNIALQALRYGAFDYVIKDEDALSKTVRMLDKVMSIDARAKRTGNIGSWLRMIVPAAAVVAVVAASIVLA